MRDILKRSYLFIIITVILVTLGTIILMITTKFNLITEKVYSNDYYSFKYDWCTKCRF